MAGFFAEFGSPPVWPEAVLAEMGGHHPRGNLRSRAQAGAPGAALSYVGDGSLAEDDGYLAMAYDDNREAGELLSDYRRMGERAFGLVAGIGFVWDARASTLLAFRGHGTGCPLACVLTETGALMSSHILTLVRARGRPSVISRGFLAGIVGGTFGHEPGETAFEGVFRLTQGTVARFGPGRSVQSARHRPASSVARAPSLYETLSSVLREAQRFASPHLMLSGGIDSTLLAATYLETGRPLRGLRLHAARQVGACPEMFRVEWLKERYPALVVDTLPAMPVDLADMTFGDGSETEAPSLGDDPLPNAAMLERARSDAIRWSHEHGSAIVLDGEGGDEVFALAPGLVGAQTTRARWAPLRALRRRWRPHEVPWLSEGMIRTIESLPVQEPARTLAEAIHQCVEHPAFVGHRARMHQLAANAGMRHRSPLVDARVVEAAIALLTDSPVREGYAKPVLADFAQRQLDIPKVRAAKTQGLASALAIESLRNRPKTLSTPLLRSWVRLTDLERAEQRSDLTDGQLEQLFNVWMVDRWLSCLQDRYPVTIPDR